MVWCTQKLAKKTFIERTRTMCERSLRVLEIEAWPKLAEKLLTEDAEVRVMCLYRDAYLVCEELDEKLEVACEERLYLKPDFVNAKTRTITATV